jgi:hypothetical protein
METAVRQQDVVKIPIGTSPWQALWNQRETIATLGGRLKALSDAVRRPTDLNLYQWTGCAGIRHHLQLTKTLWVLPISVAKLATKAVRMELWIFTLAIDLLFCG